MDQTAVAALVAAVVAVLTALFGKEAFGRLMLSGQGREDTAVKQMAGLLENSAARDAKTVDSLFSMLDKALDAVTRGTGALQGIALAMQGHEHDEGLRFAHDRETSQQILRELDGLAESLSGLGKLITDLALEILAERRERVEAE
jgi:hypothetical protein